MPAHDIIVIGASAGGVEALTRLVTSFPADIPAAIFVVLHVPSEGTSVLPRILNRAGPLPAFHALDGQKIEHGKIYIAPPNYHLLVKRGYVHLTRGPRENRHRPAIDPLFRSAARAYGARVIGVVLSGTLDDGTAGMIAIQLRKGILVVQDPDDTLYSGMPRSVIEHAQVDYIVPIAQMGGLLDQLAHEPSTSEDDPSDIELIELELDMAELDESAMQEEEHAGNPSVYWLPGMWGNAVGN